MTDAGFNRLVLWFALASWVLWAVELFVAPRTWWTVLILSISILMLAVPSESMRQAR